MSKYDDATASAESIQIDDPMSLVGRNILHKFLNENDNDEWYSGYVVSYNSAKQLHEN